MTQSPSPPSQASSRSQKLIRKHLDHALSAVCPFRYVLFLQVTRPYPEKSSQQTSLNAWTPAIDIFEDENAFLIKAELPEVNRDDVKVNLDNNVLSISGERRLEFEDKRDGYHRVERSFGQFYRSFTLPPNVNTEAITAEVKDGVLRLTLPKKEEAKPKQIEVKVS